MSPTYERLALAIAGDEEILALLATVPEPKRQPNLLLAVVRLFGGPVDDPADFRDFTVSHWPEIAAQLRVRATQTNEVGRCALLLPVLATLPQPLALLEVGASAGLGLCPDRYRYRYGDHEVGSGGPVLDCALTGRVRMGGMSTRALSFGAVAEAYERFRPGYPDELFDLVADYAGRPLRSALEIGAGTGKATRLFARPGIVVTATDPDSGMLDELRRHIPPGVSTERGAFEDLRLDERYDLVYAAAALHWTTPQGRWARMAALVRPGGVFASFGGPFRLADGALEEAVRVARAPFLADDEIPSPDGTPPEDAMQWPGTELRRSECFGEVRQRVIERRFQVGAEDYVGYLSTVSAYLGLPMSQQQEVYRRILQVLPDTVGVCADLFVHLARRRDETG